MNIFDKPISIQPNPTIRSGWTGTGPTVTAQQETIPQAPITFDSNLNQQQFDSPLTIGYQTEDITGMLGASYGESFVNSGGMALSTEIQDGLNELKKISVEKNMTGWDKFNKVMNTAYENLMKPETYPMIKMFFEARNGGEIQDVLLAGADASMEVKKSMLDNAYTQAQLNNFPTQEEKDVDLAYRKSLIPTKADEEAQKAITELNKATAELRRSQSLAASTPDLSAVNKALTNFETLPRDYSMGQLTTSVRDYIKAQYFPGMDYKDENYPAAQIASISDLVAKEMAPILRQKPDAYQEALLTVLSRFEGLGMLSPATIQTSKGWFGGTKEETIPAQADVSKYDFNPMAGQATITINTQEEYDALPSGTIFNQPGIGIRRKP